jgi:protein TonB
MATMMADPASRGPEDELFSDLVVSGPRKRQGGRAVFGASLAGHVVLITALLVVPILWPAPMPETTDYVRALFYNPPPPLPKGSAAVEKLERPKPVTEEKKPSDPDKTPLVEMPIEKPLQPEPGVHSSDQAGSPNGSDFGVPEGMEDGVEGGVVGGVPGGVLGGVIGGTGDSPVADYDQAPRLLKIAKPAYPQEAFIKKVEGVVVLEILIGVDGRVVRARVLQSLPLLDAAAIQCVYQWSFAPAVKHGRPVPSIAHAPVKFSIF